MFATLGQTLHCTVLCTYSLFVCVYMWCAGSSFSDSLDSRGFGGIQWDLRSLAPPGCMRRVSGWLCASGEWRVARSICCTLSTGELSIVVLLTAEVRFIHLLGVPIPEEGAS